MQTHLVAEIKKNEAQLESFHMSLDNEYADVLNENIDQRREEIGLTEVKGKGLMITIDVMDFGIVSDNFTPYLSPDLLNRFLNELKSLGAEEICVGDEIIIATSAVREVNGRVLLNHTPLPSFPIEIKIITNHPLRMESGLDISYIQDDFALENLQMKISKVDEIITLPDSCKKINRNIMIWGSSGSGKSTSYIIPNALKIADQEKIYEDNNKITKETLEKIAVE